MQGLGYFVRKETVLLHFAIKRGSPDKIRMEKKPPTQHVGRHFNVIIHLDDLIGGHTDQAAVLEVDGLAAIFYIVPRIVLEHDGVKFRRDLVSIFYMITYLAEIYHSHQRMLCIMTQSE